MNAAPSSYSLADDQHAAVIGSSGWLSHTCPQDAYRLAEAGRCACGHAALAAALGRNVSDILHAFPGPGLWVNDKRMIAALNTLKVGWKQHGQEIEDTGTTGMAVVWLQGIGSWMRPGVPIGARNQRTHWIATCGDAIYDLNADSWLPAEVWRGQVLPDIIARWKAQPIPAVRETFSVWDNVQAEAPSLSEVDPPAAG